MSVSYDLRLERLVDASPDLVFDLFTDGEAQQEWYKDIDGWVCTVTCDARVGGSWDMTYGPTDSEPYWSRNVFTEIDRPSRLVSATTFGEPDGSVTELELSVTFAPRDTKTLVSIVQTGFPMDPGPNQGGWPGFLDRLERVAAERGNDSKTAGS